VTSEQKSGAEVRELNRTFDKSLEGDNKEIMEHLWNDFQSYYNYLKLQSTKSRLIRYDAREFWLQGVPSPRQMVAWTKLIRMIGVDAFNDPKLTPLKLNYLADAEPMFKRKFKELFVDPKYNEVTFACGYFWKLYPERRKLMIDFVVEEMLEKGISVSIWTQDKTLKDDFKERQKRINFTKRKPRIYSGRRRIDLHYTLVENKKNINKSHVFMELPHTEAYEFRLETYFQLEQLARLEPSSGYSARKFLWFLGCLRWTTPAKLIRIVLSWVFNVTFNTRYP
jgi:hypothetical protein